MSDEFAARHLMFDDGVWFGWLGYEEPNEIPDLLRRYSEELTAIPWVLVTCIDSGRGHYVRETFNRFRSYTNSDVSPHFLGDGSALFSSADFYRIAFDLLSTFCEVWFYSSPPNEEPPSGTELTSEVFITDNRHTERRHAVAHWIKQSGCVLILGDGVGINLATQDQTLAQMLAVQ